MPTKTSNVILNIKDFQFFICPELDDNFLRALNI